MNRDPSQASVVDSKRETPSELAGGDCRHLTADHPRKHEPPWSEMYRIGQGHGILPIRPGCSFDQLRRCLLEASTACSSRRVRTMFWRQSWWQTFSCSLCMCELLKHRCRTDR